MSHSTPLKLQLCQDTRGGQPLPSRLRMFGTADDMAEVCNRDDVGVECLQRSRVVRDPHVFGSISGRKTQPDETDISNKAPVGRDAANTRLQ